MCCFCFLFSILPSFLFCMYVGHLRMQHWQTEQSVCSFSLFHTICYICFFFFYANRKWRSLSVKERNISDPWHSKYNITNSQRSAKSGGKITIQGSEITNGLLAKQQSIMPKTNSCHICPTQGEVVVETKKEKRRRCSRDYTVHMRRGRYCFLHIFIYITASLIQRLLYFSILFTAKKGFVPVRSRVKKKRDRARTRERDEMHSRS